MASPGALDPLTPERRRQMTREHLLMAAAQIFAEKGFYGTSMEEVAGLAGFSKGAVYSNFRSKEDLFLDVLGWIYDQEIAALKETLRSTDAPSESRLSDFVTLVKGQGIAAGADWSVLYEEFHLYALRNPEAKARLAELDRRDVEEVAKVIEEERERLGFRPIESATDAARIVIALIKGVSMMRSLEPELAGDEGFLDRVMEFIARGLLSAPEA
jgi:AcrR family transcriptional regulator